MGLEKSATGSFAGAGSAGGCSWSAAAKTEAPVKLMMAVMMHPTRININVYFVFIFTPLSIYTLLHCQLLAIIGHR
jgi:hypothetical protein